MKKDTTLTRLARMEHNVMLSALLNMLVAHARPNGAGGYTITFTAGVMASFRDRKEVLDAELGREEEEER